MIWFYGLRIKTDVDVSSIIGFGDYQNGLWKYELLQQDDDPYIDFVTLFVDLLKSNEDALVRAGIGKDAVTIWMQYEYENECSFSILPRDLERIGAAGISLCISCWHA